MGGALNLKKCFWFLLSWWWRAGKASSTKIEQSQTKIVSYIRGRFASQ
jgi:hypothetical protein